MPQILNCPSPKVFIIIVQGGNKKDAANATSTTSLTIPIRDVDEKTLHNLLTFIYTGTVSSPGSVEIQQKGLKC
jgi:hypothetical protein